MSSFLFNVFYPLKIVDSNCFSAGGLFDCLQNSRSAYNLRCVVLFKWTLKTPDTESTASTLRHPNPLLNPTTFWPESSLDKSPQNVLSARCQICPIARKPQYYWAFAAISLRALTARRSPPHATSVETCRTPPRIPGNIRRKGAVRPAPGSPGCRRRR